MAANVNVQLQNNHERLEVRSVEYKICSRKVKLFGHDDGYLNYVAMGGEQQMINFVKKYVRPNSVILDVGANIGATSAIFSVLVENAKIYCLEPGLKNFELLQNNIRENSFENIKPFMLGAGDRQAELLFHENSAWGYFDNNREPGAFSSKVPVVTLDKFVELERIEQVDFVKIDVEGFEPQVLEGMKGVIKRFNPKILFEFNSFALLAFGGNNPYEFLNSINKKFRYKFALSHDPNLADVCYEIDSTDFTINALHKNIVANRSVDNFLVYN